MSTCGFMLIQVHMGTLKQRHYLELSYHLKLLEVRTMAPLTAWSSRGWREILNVLDWLRRCTACIATATTFFAIDVLNFKCFRFSVQLYCYGSWDVIDGSGCQSNQVRMYLDLNKKYIYNLNLVWIYWINIKDNLNKKWFNSI